MYECFIYDATLPNARITVVYCPTSFIEAREVQRSLQKHFECDNLLPPDYILLLGTEACKERFEDFLKDDLLKVELPAFTRESDRPIRFLCTDGHPINNDASLSAMLRFSGLKYIFEKRGGLLSSRGGWHYIKPSGRHCELFLRTSNILVRGAEVSFIAFCLLRYLSDNIRHIYTDTSTINQIAFALIALKQQCSENFHPPTIASFGSYNGLESFTFGAEEQSLVLISASTSGDLEDELLKRLPLLSNSSIVTLFYLADQQPLRRQILCDTTRRNVLGSNGWLVASPSFDPGKCPICQHLPAVEIAGDQFLIREQVIEPTNLVRELLPKWLATFLSDFVGSRVLTVHRKSTDTRLKGRCTRELFLDMDRAISLSSRRRPIHLRNWSEKLKHLLGQTIPVNLRTIVPLEDDASRRLAECVKKHYLAYNSRSAVRIISADRVLRRTNSAKQSLGGGATLVVAATVVTGRMLMELSQVLRSYSRKGEATYLIAISRTRSESQIDDIRRTLEHGKKRNPEFLLQTVSDIYIPEDSPERRSPWENEITTLNLLAGEDITAKTKSQINNRLGLLKRSKNQSGLRDNLFWPSTETEKELHIRPGFTFWDFKYGREATQADVYFTISAVLHDWRLNRRKLMFSQSGSQIGAISPRTFLRFNDGVIQAAILRASLRGELNFSQSRSLSMDMLVVLNSVLLNYTRQSGEASLEFLLALAERRLRLFAEDTTEVISALRKKVSGSRRYDELIHVLCNRIMSNNSAN